MFQSALARERATLGGGGRGIVRQGFNPRSLASERPAMTIACLGAGIVSIRARSRASDRSCNTSLSFGHSVSIRARSRASDHVSDAGSASSSVVSIRARSRASDRNT